MNRHVSEGPPAYRFEVVWALLDATMDRILEMRDEEPVPVGTATDRGIARGIAQALAVWRCGMREGETFDQTVDTIREEAVERWYARQEEASE